MVDASFLLANPSLCPLVAKVILVSPWGNVTYKPLLNSDGPSGTIGSMGTIVAICSSKGGNGKSAITALLSVNLAFAGLRAAVIDADPNGSFSTWHRTTYGGYPALSVSQCIDEDEIVAHALEVSGQHNVTIIDTAGFRNQTASFAMGVASLVLIPVLPDRHSLIEAAKTVRQAEISFPDCSALYPVPDTSKCMEATRTG